MSQEPTASRIIVWVPDKEQTFVQGELLDDSPLDNKTDDIREVRLLTGNNETRQVKSRELQLVNPATFDKVENMSELTHLNEPSVLHNLENRYLDDLIYTYSGLFLVAINPYANIGRLYTQEFVDKYHGSKREDNSPHIFSIAEEAYQNLRQERKDQSILVTGESGAGKTETTKKILKYLADITTPDSQQRGNTRENYESFEMKILQSNPILEAFGNAQTVRNNNSSRFGKFIKIEFDECWKINGAYIEWYLLEKSRVTNQYPQERNYHIFYQFLSGIPTSELSQIYHLPSNSISDYRYLSSANHKIVGVDDAANFRELQAAFDIVGFTQDELRDILSIIAAILLIGNIEFVSERAEQASFASEVDGLCALLGVTPEKFQEAILRPKSKAGKEWMVNYKNASQARFILNALSRTLYEHLFAYIVRRINKSLNHGSMSTNFIGLLDIAGFEIFKHNSFEQLCINYTNEKLQQFFNHHMFVLEQTEYVKENIQWDYVDYSKDLQSTIDLIEQRIAPPGILPLLEEESILSNSTDGTFFQKLITNWENKSDRFKRSKLLNSFILRHYAGTVEYSIDGWLAKNKDPLSENLSNVLMNSQNKLVSSFFATPEDNDNSGNGGSPTKTLMGRNKAFRTTSGRHREQLNTLLNQLNMSHPHFVRCIIPNNNKRPREFDRELILNQLRCNGVLEGIRIAREGYPNRILFEEFFTRYKILNSGTVKFITGDDKRNCEIILSSLNLDPTIYKVGRTKLFFKDGVLGRLEHRKEVKILEILDQLCAYRKGKTVRNEVTKELRKLKSARVIGDAFDTYIRLMDDPWYNLYIKIKPLLSTTEDIVKNRKFSDQIKVLEEKLHERDGIYEELARQKSAVDDQLRSIQELLRQNTEKLKVSEIALKNMEDKNGQLQIELNEAAQIREKLNEERLKTLEELNRASTQISKLTQKTKEQTNTSNDASIKLLTDKNLELKNKLAKLESEKIRNVGEISNLKRQLSNSAKDLNSKLSTLERSCNVAKERLQVLLEENAELRSQLYSSKEEYTALGKQLDAKVKELHSATEIANKYEAQISSLFSERNNLQRERDQYMNDVRTLRSKVEAFNGQRQSRQSRQSSLKIQSEVDHPGAWQPQRWEDQLAEQHTQFTSMARRVLTVDYEPRIENHDFGSPILGTNNEQVQLSRLKEAYEKEKTEKEGILNKLRVTETRLASVSFECQTVRSQVKKLKTLLRNSNIPEDTESFDKENSLVVRTLRPQSTVGFERNIVDSHNPEQHDKSTYSAEYYRKKYEASEKHAKELELKLGQFILRDRTNLPNTPNTPSKTDEELRAQKMNNFRLQEILNEANKKVNLLTSELKQFTLKENLLNENINRLQKELDTAKNQKEMISEQFKQQKEQLETCLSDLHSNEVQLKDCVRMLKQAEDDVKNMGGMLDRLRTQIKEKDKQIWDTESHKNDLELQLQDTLLELKRENELNVMLKSDIDHWKNQFQAAKNNSRYIKSIEQLKDELNASMRNETELNKQVATLKYKLEMANNDSETKINDLLQQVQHYTHLVEVLGNERDTAETSEKELSGKYAELTKERDDLLTKVSVLMKEKEALTNEFEVMQKKLSETIAGNEAYQQQTNDMSDEIKTLKDTLQLQKVQGGRNEELVKKLQDDILSYRDKFETEKQKSINLFEENQTLKKVNGSMNGKLEELQMQLGDTTERDVWLTKIQELEKMVADETKLKYEEIKKSKQQERVIKDLLQKNQQQTDVINAANEDRAKFESSILSYNNQIADLENLISTQELNLKKMERESLNYRDRATELERQLQFLQNRESDGTSHQFAETSPSRYIAGEVIS